MIVEQDLRRGAQCLERDHCRDASEADGRAMGDGTVPVPR
jgi:hypothetical protein